MKKKDLETFLNHEVNVNVPHLFLADRTFIHSGKLIELNDEFLILKLNNKKGLVRIKNEDILQILQVSK